MGLQTAPAYIGKSGFTHPVELDRNVLRSISGARTGLARWGDFAVTPTGVSGQVSISRGGAFLLGPETALQGSYFAFSDTAVTALFTAASGNPRIDTLLLRVADDQYGSIPVGAPQAYFDVVQGVASGSPSARPDSDFNLGGSFYVPGAWFRIADVRRNLGDTTIPGGQITSNLRSARLGGLVICKSTDRPTDAVYGDRIIEYDTSRRLWWNGSVWVLEPGQLLYAKFQNDNGYLVQALTGFQTAFTSPSIAIEPNQTVYVNVRMPFICVPTAGNDIDGIIAIQENAGGYVDKHKIGVSKMPLANNYYPLTSRFPYKIGSASTINVRLTAWSSNLYDVRCDPLYSFHLFVETTGKMNSEWV